MGYEEGMTNGCKSVRNVTVFEELDENLQPQKNIFARKKKSLLSKTLTLFTLITPIIIIIITFK